eukprot:TRINITY_DN1798_c1_g1_i2.p1 TRINITY_DN1798_c1_g1~~TRINITY_DN1798_c1_g1_i2.p1  ORF type:complete len:746 (+),score=252.35 TRINITY_DN1798_c1_g1_i2:678-2915(+)
MGNGCCKGDVADRSETRYGQTGVEEDYHGVAMEGNVQCDDEEWMRGAKGARMADRVKRHLEEEPLRVAGEDGSRIGGAPVMQPSSGQHSASSVSNAVLSGVSVLPREPMGVLINGSSAPSEKNKLLHHHSSSSSRSSLGDSMTWIASDIDTTVPSIPPSPHPPAPLPWSRLLSLDPQYDSIDIFEDVFSFGRSKSCSYTFPNNMVSHVQFKLHFVDRRTQTVEIEDVFSTNGTFVYGFTSQGKIVGRQSLQHGDQITFQIYTAPLAALQARDPEKKQKKKKAMAAGYIFHVLHNNNQQVYETNAYLGRDRLAHTHGCGRVVHASPSQAMSMSATHPQANLPVKLPDVHPEIEPDKAEGAAEAPPQGSVFSGETSSPLLRYSSMGLTSDKGTPTGPAAPVARAAQDNKTATSTSTNLKYRISNAVLGTGANSAVHLGLVQVTGELVAVKRLRKSTTDFEISCLIREIEILSRLSHGNIVKYIGAQMTDQHFDVLLEFVPGGSIASLIKKFGALDESVTRNYLVQILAGLRYLHDNHVVHMDIKGANILVTSEGKCRLTDFGASKTRSSSTPASPQAASPYDIAQRVTGPFCGTPLYMAPEVAREAVYTAKSDVWSLGCTLIEMCSGKLPWEEKGFENSFAVVNFHMRNTMETPKIPSFSKLGQLGHDFCSQCFRMNASLRPSCVDLLKHVFITSSVREHESISEFNPNTSQATCNDFESISLNGLSPPPSQPPSGHFSLPSIGSQL